MTDRGDGHYSDDDELLASLIPESGHPDVNVLAGVFLGKGPDGTSRLYTTLQLDQYFQIPRDKILGAKRFPAGRVVVWVPADLRVQLISSDTIAGDFLKGSIQSVAARRSVGSGGFRSLLARAGPSGGTSWGGCRTDFIDPSDPTCTLIGCGPPQPPPTGCSC